MRLRGALWSACTLSLTSSRWILLIVLEQFDIVKVRLQSGNEYSSTFNCASRILKEEGPKAFYKGASCFDLVGGPDGRYRRHGLCV